jgi:hypothetical protein
MLLLPPKALLPLLAHALISLATASRELALKYQKHTLQPSTAFHKLRPAHRLPIATSEALRHSLHTAACFSRRFRTLLGARTSKRHTVLSVLKPFDICQMRNTTVFFCDGNLIIFRKFRSYRD